MDFTPNRDDLRTLRAVTQLLEPFSAGAFIFPCEVSNPEDIVDQGTISFINTGEERLCVTAKHVIDKFREVCEQTPEAILYISDTSRFGGDLLRIFIPCGVHETLIVDESDELDLVTLKLNSGIDIHPKQYYQSENNEWPPRRAREGEPVAIVGFPGDDTQRTRSELNIGIASYVIEVVDVGDSRFLINTNFDWHVYASNPEAGISPFLPGGLSGSLVFSYTRPLTLLGVINSCFEPEEGGDTQLPVMIATHIDRISEDGAINR
jgi:hypothetical protein